MRKTAANPKATLLIEFTHITGAMPTSLATTAALSCPECVVSIFHMRCAHNNFAQDVSGIA
jgi:hypothetical protein